jgi:adenylate kinase
MRIILFGSPGSGKGTQGDLVEKEYGFPRISTGDLLRRAVRDGTPLGRRAEALMNRGQLVSDDIVEGLVRERIAQPDCRRGYLLDGFPRNPAQVKSLEAMDGRRPEVVIEIVVASETIVERLGHRRVCADCGAVYNLADRPPKVEGRCDVCGGRLEQRRDDRPEVIAERLRVYRAETAQIRGHYQAKNVYHAVDGAGAVADVFGRIRLILDQAVEETGAAEAQ